MAPSSSVFTSWEAKAEHKPFGRNEAPSTIASNVRQRGHCSTRCLFPLSGILFPLLACMISPAKTTIASYSMFDCTDCCLSFARARSSLSRSRITKGRPSTLSREKMDHAGLHSLK
ncbi:hypothetical protein DL93DRAFT_2091170 [Clavulina sp. PMI_390]|nr:hypothetical protein DL93DRAFT_2091170 [Clavulina sp. PMI_390]